MFIGCSMQATRRLDPCPPYRMVFSFFFGEMGVGVWLALFLFFCGLSFPFFFLYFSRAVRSLGLFPCVTEDMNYMGWFWGGGIWGNWED